jgi:hypothetical protein
MTTFQTQKSRKKHCENGKAKKCFVVAWLFWSIILGVAALGGAAPPTITPNPVTIPVGGSATVSMTGTGPFILASSNPLNASIVSPGVINIDVLPTATPGTYTFQIEDTGSPKPNVVMVQVNVIPGAAPAASLNINPNLVTVPEGGNATATITGGTPPYIVGVSFGSPITPVFVPPNTIEIPVPAGTPPGMYSFPIADSAAPPAMVTLQVEVIPMGGPPGLSLSVDVSSVTIPQGDVVQVATSGGTPPYHANPIDPHIAAVHLPPGANIMTIEGLNPGTTFIEVTDSAAPPAITMVQVTVTSGAMPSPPHEFTVGGCAAGPNVNETINTAEVSTFNLLLCREVPNNMEGALYVSLAVPDLFADLLFCRPAEDVVPRPGGLYIELIKDQSGFLPHAEEMAYYRGPLSIHAGNLSFRIGTGGLQGLTLVFSTFFVPEGLPLNEFNQHHIQMVTVHFN